MIKMYIQGMDKCEVLTHEDTVSIDLFDGEIKMASILFSTLTQAEQFAQDVLNQINQIKGSK